jgi:hypothetical protein
MNLDPAFMLSDVVALLGEFLNSSLVQFVAQGKCTDCPGAESTLVAAAWANIGYMTHAALLHYVNFSGFGLWAPLLYLIGAIGALVAVAINSPPRNYTWFLLGPAIYGFLIGSTQEVKGVDWVVAGRPQNLEEVWRDAETGLRNSPLLQIPQYSKIKIDKINGPSDKYPVAMPMLFFDELFSATSNMLVEWTGLYQELGEGDAKSNLHRATNLVGSGDAGAGKTGEGPWYLMSTIKAPMVENIVSAHIRNPQLRDALVTFLASECGEALKKGVNSGAYNAATMTRGSVIPMTVMIDGANGANDFSKGSQLSKGDYRKSRFELNAAEMPTPRSLFRLLAEPSDVPGSFGKFSPAFQGSDGGESKLRSLYSEQINCSAYLWILVQGMRHEMGHAYWQLVRSAPRGFDEPHKVLHTLFYGWDIRKSGTSAYADEMEIEWFTQNLIFAYILKNELMFAPQITSTEQKFAPSEKTTGYSQAYVGSVGATTKSSELYNWAVMMPHIQGILLYVIIVGYPFAAMAMIIPGYWKGFFTWVTFFAWIKLWDVGFAVVQVLERSVWAMMGNHSNMARVANMLIQTGYQAQGVNVECNGNGDGTDVMGQCAVPDVTNGITGVGDAGGDQKEAESFFYLDKALLLGAALDLDVSNGYYLYIMAALYFAVPAVTGQLVLGAKSGLGGLLTNSLSDGARDISGAAKSGIQGEKTNQIATNKESLSQAALGKAFRSPGNSFLSSLEASNRGLDKGRHAAQLGAIDKALGAGASAAELKAKSFGGQMGVLGAQVNALAETGGYLTRTTMGAVGRAVGGGGDRNGQSGGGNGIFGVVGSNFNAMREMATNAKSQDAYGVSARAAMRGADINWAASGASQSGQALSQYSRSLSDMASFEAETAAWDARNSFASNAGMAGVYGVNAGSLAPGQKPSDKMGMALTGALGSQAQQAAHYSGNSFLSGTQAMVSQGKSLYGSGYVGSFWQQYRDNGQVYPAVRDQIGPYVPAQGENVRTLWQPISENGGELLKKVGSAMVQGAAAAEMAHAGVEAPPAPKAPTDKKSE